MREIVFALTVEDCIAFADYHWAHSPAGKRERRTVLLVAGSVFLGIGLFEWIDGGSVVVAMPYFVFGAIWLALTPRFLRWIQSWQMRNAYRDAANRSLIGDQRVRLDTDGLTWALPYSETRYQWSAFEKLASTPDHTFLYVGALLALIIPRQAVREGDYDAFVSALAERVKAAA